MTFTPPSKWLESGIIPVPKKGDLTDPFYYRGISLTPIAAKMYNKLILNRLIPPVDPILRMNQNGFRKGRSAIAQILSLRRIIEEMNRESIFEILPLYGIPHHIIKAIRALYTNTKASVITPDGETDFFDIEAGVLQGDTLAPFLFIIVLDYVLRISLDQHNEKGLQLHPRRS
ncbi:LINE-1 retrotransposable element ORF2 protein [Exaiptasia diaphana]|nr:LINE-1 retrotransposable element ORF2 protein [Exaiptasia diaphana]